MFLREIDMLSPHITLYHKRKNIHPSVFAGILTLIAYIFILVVSLIYFIRFINRENLTAYIFNRFVKDIGTYSFSDGNFFHFI